MISRKINHSVVKTKGCYTLVGGAASRSEYRGFDYFFLPSFFLPLSSHFDLQQSDFVLQSDFASDFLSAFFSDFLSSTFSTAATTGAALTGAAVTPIKATSAINTISFFMILDLKLKL
jgi:hypothetical protein